MADTNDIDGIGTSELYGQPASEFGPYGDEVLTAQLREAVRAFETANTLSAPLRAPIENLLRVAADAVNAVAASVLVRDHELGGLRFVAAIGDVSDKLIDMRIPPGKGVAGLVLMSGQPMAVADASHEGSIWTEADKRTGFKTVTLMATPLHAGEEVVGVLQFINRPGAPPYTPFTPEEMHTAAHFAESIGRLVHAHEVATVVESLFEQWVKEDAVADDDDGTSHAELRAWVNNTPMSADYREFILLGLSLFEIAGQGASQRELCRDLLAALTRFAKKDLPSGTSFLNC